MKFVTFVWVNSIAVTFAFLALDLKEQELNLVCTNTHTQRSSILDGRMITSDGSVDTFGTTITMRGSSSLELGYPAKEPSKTNIFEVLENGEGYLLSQSTSGSKLSTLKLVGEVGKWWGQLIEFDYQDTSTAEFETKIYYCS